MKKHLIVLASITTLFFASSNAQATPTLQLDIAGGLYDDSPGVETIFSNGDVFTLYAYLIPNDNNSLTDTYFISAALTPKTANSGDYGEFLFAGDTIDVTADMTYGTPPVDTAYPDLGSHSIYDTFYREFEFSFDSTQQAAIQNSEDDAGLGPQPGTGMYYYAFDVDTSGLLPGYEIHFDLYNQNIKASNNKEFINFAPYSHDAQSGTAPVPEPATMLLFGTGLAGLIGSRLRRK